MQQVIAIGNLTKDPELAYAQSGTAYCNFSVAVNEKWRDKNGESKEKCEFINCTAFGKTAENLASYQTKGCKIFVSGKLQTDKVERDGDTKFYTKVIVDRIEFLGRPQGDGATRDNRKAPASTGQRGNCANDRREYQSDHQTANDGGYDDDDIPF